MIVVNKPRHFLGKLTIQRKTFLRRRTMSFGWTGNILKIDLSNRKTSTVPTEPYTQSFIGGRGISVKMMYDQVDPKLSPFDPGNDIFFGPGVLTGTPSAGSSRLKITALGAGGYLRHAGLGGDIANAIKWAGYDLVVVQGKLDKPSYIYIHNDEIEFRDAGHIWGQYTYETERMIKDEIGQTAAVLCIGPAGENQVSYGSVHCGLGSAAGRCGMGGVMGSKNLKAIAVTGTRGVKIARMEEFLRVAAEQRKQYSEDRMTNFLIRDEVNALASGWQEAGLGARGNFGSVEWDDIGRAKILEFEKKYASSPHVCGSCPISHFHTFDVPGIGKGGAKCTGTYSVTGTLWNNDVKLGFKAYNLINNYGMDVMSTTNIIAFLMELYEKKVITAKDTDGIPMNKGDADAIIPAIHKIAKQEGFGKIFKDGVEAAAKEIGRGAEEYAMSVKGLELQPMEVRYMKPYALANATNTKDYIDTPCDVVYGWALAPNEEVREEIEQFAEKVYGTRDAARPDKIKAAALPVVDYENKVVAADMIGICKYIIPMFFSPFLDVQAKLASLATGREISESDLMTAGQRVVTLERAYNVIMGMRRKHDTMPKRILEEPVPSGPNKGVKLNRADFKTMLDHYYDLHTYDKKGIPKEAAFKKFNLIDEWLVFKEKVPEAQSDKSAAKSH
jgi:aldehyde:ferredoxin oxidoreductase